MVFKKILSLVIVSLTISSCSSAVSSEEFSSSSSEELEEGYVATFSNGQKMTFFEATCDVETYYKNNYKTFDKLDAETINFRLSNYNDSYILKMYYVSNSMICHGVQDFTRWIDYKVEENYTNVVISSIVAYNKSRNMYLFSLDDGQSLYYLPFYIGAEYLDNSLMDKVNIKPSEIESIEIKRWIYEDGGNGRPNEYSETLKRDDDEIKIAYSSLFEEFDLLFDLINVPADYSGLPGPSLNIQKTNGEQIIVYFKVDYFNFDGNIFVF